MYYELSKREKKIARACIDKGLEAEFREALEKSTSIIADWKEGKYSNHQEAYHKLYKTIDQKDQTISRRYDGLSGSRWLVTVAAIFFDGYISETDIQEFSDETKTIINNLNLEWRTR
jgi:hypothetical protein